MSCHVILYLAHISRSTVRCTKKLSPATRTSSAGSSRYAVKRRDTRAALLERGSMGPYHTVSYHVTSNCCRDMQYHVML